MRKENGPWELVILRQPFMELEVALGRLQIKVWDGRTNPQRIWFDWPGRIDAHLRIFVIC